MEQSNTTRRASSRRQKSQRMRQLQGACLAIGFFALVLLFGLIAIFSPDRAFSDVENRALSQRPKLTADAVTSGSYGEALSSYTADQFPGRDFWVRLKTKGDLILGKDEVNGVYVCDDDYLIETPSAANEESMAENLEAINTFVSSHSELDCHVCIVPNAIYVMSDKLPKNAPGQNQAGGIDAIRQQLRGVNFQDVTQTLCDHADEALYYRTDHHWTSLAASYAFSQLAPSLSISPVKDYDVYTVSDSFEGTLASKCGFATKQDVIEIYVPKTDVIYNVTCSGTSETGEELPVSRSMYVRERLNDKNQYTVFFGGNYPLVTVDTTADCGRTLLMFKDSYANCMVQFLYPYFDHILMVDPRYYTGSVSSLIRQNGVTDVLFFYNYATFTADTSLATALTY